MNYKVHDKFQTADGKWHEVTYNVKPNSIYGHRVFNEKHRAERLSNEISRLREQQMKDGVIEDYFTEWYLGDVER